MMVNQTWKPIEWDPSKSHTKVILKVYVCTFLNDIIRELYNFDRSRSFVVDFCLYEIYISYDLFMKPKEFSENIL